MKVNAPKGTKDILPEEVYKWHYIEDVIQEICNNFNYNQIRLPVFEHTELFQRGVGDTTDIVQKEMYTFEDKGGRSITLRPEGTAGVVRSYIEHGMASKPSPVKLYYNITAYRYENVQKGRYREFNQFGVEAFGSNDPQMDIEVIMLMKTILEKLDLTDVVLKINSIGCPQCRAKYNQMLKEYLAPCIKSMCENCQTRFEKNPLRILDCKEDRCKEQIEGAPLLADYLCEDCNNHFEQVKHGLDACQIDYQVDKMIVRGLDYYVKTVFEFVSENVGTQGTICGGGRYDGLVKVCGGSDEPGIGFAMGLERLLMELDSRNFSFKEPEKLKLYISSVGDESKFFASRLTYQLRKQGLKCQNDISGRSLKAQMKHADKMQAQYVLVIGDDEREEGAGTLKNMATGETKTIFFDQLYKQLCNTEEA
ncbi:MAG TPA: histidine--tRNA ligase [Clostridiales bacterium]|nr:histidine--tRNA ligase [Clostridiales bacterium]